MIKPDMIISTFAQKVRSLLFGNGYADDDLHKLTEEEHTSFEFIFHKKRYSHYTRRWNNDLSKFSKLDTYPDSKIQGANMGPTWVLSAPDWPHVGTMNLAIRVLKNKIGLPNGTAYTVCTHKNLQQESQHWARWALSPNNFRNEYLCNVYSLGQVDDQTKNTF